MVVRAIMGRRIEFGAGVAAIILALPAALLLLFAPLIPYCPIASHTCAASELRYRSLLQSNLSAVGWALVLLPAIVALAGGVGAILDTRMSGRAGLFTLGAALFLGLIFCVLGVTGVGIVYLPAILGLGLASYGAYLRRRSIGAPSDTGA
jgi:hypothetical protein